MIRKNEDNKMWPLLEVFDLMAIQKKMYSPLQTHVVTVLLKYERK